MFFKVNELRPNVVSFRYLVSNHEKSTCKAFSWRFFPKSSIKFYRFSFLQHNLVTVAQSPLNHSSTTLQGSPAFQIIHFRNNIVLVYLQFCSNKDHKQESKSIFHPNSERRQTLNYERFYL